VAYEIGTQLGRRKLPLRSGIASGVDKWFCRGASEELKRLGQDPNELLTCYRDREARPDHPYGRQLRSALRRREEGVPEIISESDVVVLLGGAKNTQYIGVLALLERKIVLPVAATEGAALDLHAIILSRFDRTMANRVDIDRFKALGDTGTTPAKLAERVADLVDAYR
jgi:hypothetical protein